MYLVEPSDYNGFSKVNSRIMPVLKPRGCIFVKAPPACSKGPGLARCMCQGDNSKKAHEYHGSDVIWPEALAIPSYSLRISRSPRLGTSTLWNYPKSEYVSRIENRTIIQALHSHSLNHPTLPLLLMGSPLSDDAKKFRRTHKKSRLGCQRCKKRKIKCDETRPVCRNCVRSDVTCIYHPHPRADSTELASTTPPFPGALLYDASQRNDLETLTFDRDKRLEEVSKRLSLLETEVHQLKCQQQIQLQDGDTNLLLHYCRVMTASDATPSNKFWGEQLPSLALGPQPGDYMGFSTEGRPNLLVLIRGLKALRKDQVSNDGHVSVTLGHEADSMPTNPTRAECLQQVVELRSMINRRLGPVQPELREIYLMALEDLIPFYEVAYASKSPSKTTSFDELQPFGWLYRASAKYLDCLEAKEPVALVIFAHFSVILDCTPSSWHVKGWSKHIILGIEGILPDSFQQFVQWPSQQIKKGNIWLE
uniref:Zn(2)-C6 fungal-type domain-containing protein n=1 Tax=Fusarium oxysporum (strain Fo5176) TaxID=660025 RepID=A0A0D2XL16_FUSOF